VSPFEGDELIALRVGHAPASAHVVASLLVLSAGGVDFALHSGLSCNRPSIHHCKYGALQY